jgi:viroplasmin and RNaseH domain-containing protein
MFRVYGRTGIKFNQELVYIDGLINSVEEAEEFVERCNKILAITPKASYRKISDFVWSTFFK